MDFHGILLRESIQATGETGLPRHLRAAHKSQALLPNLFRRFRKLSPIGANWLVRFSEPPSPIPITIPFQIQRKVPMLR
ncbi:MAG: hypothetical protein IPQ13_02135 [Holophagaceae bacterium]|nr:hypothetical protein [Holophagaceae bacterium]